jgi:hypothetical protein
MPTSRRQLVVQMRVQLVVLVVRMRVQPVVLVVRMRVQPVVLVVRMRVQLVRVNRLGQQQDAKAHCLG